MTVTPRTPAEAYEASIVTPMMEPWARVFLDHVSVRPGNHVLDVACGTGAVALAALDRVGPNGSVTGCDINPAMLEFAQRKAAARGASITWIRADAEHLPTRAGGFDVVVCQHGLQFFPDTQVAIRAMYGALVPGGTVGVNVWDSVERQRLFADFDRVRRDVFGDRSSQFQPFILGDDERLRRELTAAGFVDVRVESVPGITTFPQADRFAEQSIRAAAAVMPELASLTPAELDDVITRMASDLAPYVDRYRVGQAAQFEMTALFATATRSQA